KNIKAVSDQTIEHYNRVRLASLTSNRLLPNTLTYVTIENFFTSPITCTILNTFKD
ncbi:5618_t:CDS:1, partial [Funneliformis caledonium]